MNFSRISIRILIGNAAVADCGLWNSSRILIGILVEQFRGNLFGNEAAYFLIKIPVGKRTFEVRAVYCLVK